MNNLNQDSFALKIATDVITVISLLSYVNYYSNINYANYNLLRG